MFKELALPSHLGAVLKRMDDQDEFIQAALFEAISFIARRDTHRAREAISLLDGPWIDLEHPEDLALLFDNL